QCEIGRQRRCVVLRKKPGKKVLRPKDGIERYSSCQTEEQKTDRVMLASHLDSRINAGNSIDESLDRLTNAVQESALPGKDSFDISAQGLYKDGENDDERHILKCTVQVHQPPFNLLRSDRHRTAKNHLAAPRSCAL